MVKRNRKTKRNKNIYALRRIGISYKNIAQYYGLSIIRVRQIIEAQEAADDSLCKDNSRQVQAASGSRR